MAKPRNNSKDAKLDLRFTPPYAITPLIELLQLTKEHIIWEAAAGEGDLLMAMIDKCPVEANFHATDIMSGQDFFDSSTIPPQFKDNSLEQLRGIITNPPYSMKPQWLKRCFELTQNVALLLPVESLASSKLRTIWNENNGVSILLTDTRIDFRGNNEKWYQSACNFSSAWFISGFNVEPDRILHSSIKDEKRDFKQSCRFLNI